MSLRGKTGRSTVIQEIVIDVGVDHLPHNERDHDSPADRLVRAERLNEDREDSNEQRVPGCRQHIPQQILSELDLGVAGEKLVDHRRSDVDEHDSKKH